MSRLRIALLGVIGLLPLLFLMGVGGYHLWATGWFFYVWWPMAACWIAASLLARRWGRQQRRNLHAEPPPGYFTERDRLAWQHVETRLKATENVAVDQLGDPQFYFDTSRSLAEELAKIYHPDSSRPMGNVTLPELLTVAELASRDLGELAEQYFPGGHLLTINHFHQARGALKWYQRASNIWWGVSAVLDPLRTGARFLASRAGVGKSFDLVKQNAVLWLYAMFVQRLGHYLIELFSGRLKVGADRYRELLDEHKAGPAPSPGDAPADPSRPVTIAILGQVKAGKSSLINALLGEERARTDVIPATSGNTRYELRRAASSLLLLDTPGYNQAGADPAQLDATTEAAEHSDLLLLVTQARNPARQADVDLLKELKSWFADRPHLRMPPILVVMSHIDLLTPAMEWAPPYDWRRPARPKEIQIEAAAKVASGQLGEGVLSIIPVCTAPGKIFGIEEELLPEVTELLGEARAVAMLRCLHAEADEGQVQRVFDQLLHTGKALLRTMLKPQ